MSICVEFEDSMGKIFDIFEAFSGLVYVFFIKNGELYRLLCYHKETQEEMFDRGTGFSCKEDPIIKDELMMAIDVLCFDKNFQEYEEFLDAMNEGEQKKLIKERIAFNTMMLAGKVSILTNLLYGEMKNKAE